MELKLLEKKDEKLTFSFKGTTPAFANALRRSVIDNVPTMAIEQVEFRKNTSILYDEIIAHRLGLLPLTTDLKSYMLPLRCKCEGKGCARCTLVLTLSAKGPSTVYASDIKSKDPKVKPAFPKTPIVKLLKGQSLEFEATAMLGTGEDHAKWTPALAFYKYMPIIDITKNPSNPEEVAKSCPVDVFEVKDGKLKIKEENLLKCHLCGACVDTSEGTVKLNESDKDFIFTVESWGQLTPKEILLTAIDEFDHSLDEFVDVLKEI